MQSVEVDFEVYKLLTVRRATEHVTYNDVIRELLGIGGKQTPTAPSTESVSDWITKGVRFPEGTEFRAEYKGRQFKAVVEAGALLLNGKRFESPSSAAMSITESATNGWVFWECRLPGHSSWKLIKSLRGE